MKPLNHIFYSDVPPFVEPRPPWSKAVARSGGVGSDRGHCAEQEFDIALRPGDRAGLRHRALASPSMRPMPPPRRTRAAWIAGSRTTPPLPTSPRPASNCGLTSATSIAPGRARSSAASSTLARPMKLASHTTISTGSGTMSVRQVAGIGLFVDDHAVVAAQFPRQLVGADVDRIDLRRALGQQHIGEPAGRASDVERHRAGHVEPEMLQPMRQLDPAARHPRMIAALDGQQRIVGEQVPRLRHPPVTNKHIPRQDQRLRPSPALGQPLRDEQKVGADPGHLAGE